MLHIMELLKFNVDDFTFAYYIPPFFSSIPDGILEYSIDSWSNGAVRCGLFDYQNGMFFEFDGTELACVKDHLCSITR